MALAPHLSKRRLIGFCCVDGDLFEVCVAVTALMMSPLILPSAMRLAAALRRPWAEQWVSPASLQRSRNQLPKPAAVKGLSNSVMRNAGLSFGSALMASVRGRQHKQIKLRARFALFNADRLSGNLMPAHGDYIAAALRGIEKQIEGKARFAAFRVSRFIG